MQNGPKTIMSARQPRPAASFATRSKRWASSAARPEPKSSQNAQRNYERYLALTRDEAQIGNTVGARALPVHRTLFQIDALGPRRDVETLFDRCVRALQVSRSIGQSSCAGVCLLLDQSGHCGFGAGWLSLMTKRPSLVVGATWQ